MTATPLTIKLRGCDDCHRSWTTVFAGCPFCGSTALTDREAEGRGTVYSWVEVLRSLEDPPADVPYTVVVVELEAGARVFGRYRSGDVPEPDEPVELIEVSSGEPSVLTFRPRERARKA